MAELVESLIREWLVTWVFVNARAGSAAVGKVHSAGSPKAARQAVDALETNKYCRKGDNCIDISASEHYDTTDCDAGETCVTSFLTMESVSGVTFGITNIVGNFGTVFVDQSYWQSAVAAKPKSAQLVFHNDSGAWRGETTGLELADSAG